MRKLLCLFFTVAVLSPLGVNAQRVADLPKKQLSAVRVNVTNQQWNFLTPWSKRPPYSRRAIGAVLPGGRVLVTAELVANATFLEFEAPDGGAKAPATIEAVDYECNLAILKTEDAPFMKAYAPLEIARSCRTISLCYTKTPFRVIRKGVFLCINAV